MQEELTFWDSTATPTAMPGGVVYCWNGYVESDGIHSILQYVETHSERLRRKYLEWIHDLGEATIGGRRVVDHLARADGFSYWWMTLLVEKSPWKTPSIVDAISLMALEDIVVERRPAVVRLVSASVRLRQVVSGLCQNLKIRFEQRAPTDPPPRSSTLKSFYRGLPQPLQALIGGAKHLRMRWPLRRQGAPGWQGGSQARFFCSYFVHLDQKSAQQGRFYSRQWEGLAQLAQDCGYFCNWLHHFEPHGAVPDAAAANEWLRRFNSEGARTLHAFVDSFLSWPIVLRVLSRWLRFNLLRWKLSGVRRAFQPRGSHLSLWPVMGDDWIASLCGPPAIINLLWAELFEKGLSSLARQPQGLYLFEGQGWERAFIHSWRKHGHGKLIAVAHSTVRYWDLRYFDDPRTVRSNGPCAMPRAELTALNGKVAIEAYAGLDFPTEAIAECEAVRYTYLNNLPLRRQARRAPTEPVELLVLGDIVRASTHSLLKLLEAALPLMSIPIRCTVKPHPNCAVDAGDYPLLRADVVANPLGEILTQFDIAFSAKLTSAGVDAYLAGLPVLVMLDGSELNFSPLRGLPGVGFVTTAAALAEALQQQIRAPAQAIARDDFFFLDPGLPRWRRLLQAPGTPS